MRALIIGFTSLALNATACGRAAAVTSADDQPVISKEFVIVEGQSVTLASTALRIAFRRADDSRCPSDVVCIRAGDTAVELGLSGIGAAVIDTVGSRQNLGDARYGGFVVRYVDLLPYPATNRPATLRSVKLVVSAAK